MPRKDGEKLLSIVVPDALNKLWQGFIKEEEGKRKEHGAKAVYLYIKSPKVREQAARAWKKYKKECLTLSEAAERVVDESVQPPAGRQAG